MVDPILTPLLAWLIRDAAGPHAVEKAMDHLGSRGDWKQALSAQLASSDSAAKLNHRQRSKLRRWLDSPRISDLFVDGDMTELAGAIEPLSRLLEVPEDVAAAIMDDIAGRFLQVLEPSLAVAVSDLRRASADQDSARALERIESRLQELSVSLVPQVRPARSVYHRTVEQVAPLRLIGRESELTALAAFCTEPDRGPYVWWRADAWAGKSALMATFVLNPPANVDVVSFFITARLAAQNDRTAFVHAVTVQAAALLGESIPVDPDGGDAQVLDLLARAAEAAQARGRRLVLLVDGLDEDRGVRLGDDVHSIAALLPARPAAGMRVIVTGRPNPPLPSDVPTWHPLRDPGIVKVLARSPAADSTRQTAGRELDRLLNGTDLEQDILALITAAGGGLTVHDLTELTGRRLRLVEGIVHTVSGRVFTSRPAQWRPDHRPPTYVLGHEELQNTAAEYLADRLASDQDRLHTWAGEYTRRSWPAETPEYLLDGYFRMLQAVNDSDRLIALALDAGRHDRMLDVSGGDATALAEVRAALQVIIGHADPDLTAALLLTLHRDQLTDRGAHIPPALPAVWAKLGQTIRAESLAHSIVDPSSQARALIRLIGVLAATGRAEHALSLSVQAEQVIRSIAHSFDWWSFLTTLVRTLAVHGQFDRAEQIARTIDQPYWQGRALSGLTGALADHGQHDQAEQIARTIDQPRSQAEALISIVEALTENREDTDRARDLMAQAEEVAGTITESYGQAMILVRLVIVRSDIGDLEHALALATLAENATRTVFEARAREGVLTRLSRALVAIGQPERAAQVAPAVTDSMSATEALVSRARALSAAGDRKALLALAEQACSAVAEISYAPSQVNAASELIEALVAVDEPDQAEQCARVVVDPQFRAETLTCLADALVAAGHPDEAVGFLEEAEQTARAVTDPNSRIQDLIRRIDALTATGAEQSTGTVTDLRDRGLELARLVRGLAAGGEFERGDRIVLPMHMRMVKPAQAQTHALSRLARTLAAGKRYEEAEETARAITDPTSRTEALITLARAEAAAGELVRAVALAEPARQAALTITDPTSRTSALTDLIEVFAAACEQATVLALAEEAQQAAADVPVLHSQAWYFTNVVRALTSAGEFDRAEELAGIIDDPFSPGHPVLVLVEALVAGGEFDRAERKARAITEPAHQVAALAGLSEAVLGAGKRERALELARDAEQTAHGIASPDSRAWALTRVFGAVAGASEREHALALAEHAELATRAMTAAEGQAGAVATLAEALATAGELEHAHTLALAAAEAYLDDEDDAEELASLSQALVLTGELDRAVQVAQTISNSSDRSSALSELVKVFVAAGEFDRAERTTRAVPEGRARADALVLLVQDLLGRGADREARRQIARFCSTGDWWSALPALALVASPPPAAVGDAP